jgi:hypothetical protein
MDDSRTFIFYSNGKRNPYIQKLIDYSVNKDTKEGHIQFNGYYYVEDNDFPIIMPFITELHEDKPSKKEIMPNGTTEYTFETLETSFYHVEFYKRDTIIDTSVTSTIEDEDGEEMNVCFFPTAEQKIYFRVLKEFDDDKSFFKATRELISIKSIDEKEENTTEINHRPRDITEVISELLGKNQWQC